MELTQAEKKLLATSLKRAKSYGTEEEYDGEWYYIYRID